MASTFTWLDCSEHERRRMLDAIHLFREMDTRDELGIGSVRDAIRSRTTAAPGIAWLPSFRVPKG